MIVAGGYLLVHRADTAEGVAELSGGPAGLDGGSGFLTASDCLTCSFPSWWAVPEVGVDLEERRSLLAHWGIGSDGLPDVLDATATAYEEGELGWPSVFRSLAAARSFARTTGVVHPTLTLVGLGLSADDVSRFLEGHDPDESGYLSSVSQRQPLAEGVDAGWEVLGYDGGGFHSWRCHPEAAETVAADLGPEGLLRTREAAVAVADVYDDPTTPTEDVTWLAWLLRTYTLKRRH